MESRYDNTGSQHRNNPIFPQHDHNEIEQRRRLLVVLKLPTARQDSSSPAVPRSSRASPTSTASLCDGPTHAAAPMAAAIQPQAPFGTQPSEGSDKGANSAHTRTYQGESHLKLKHDKAGWLIDFPSVHSVPTPQGPYLYTVPPLLRFDVY